MTEAGARVPSENSTQVQRVIDALALPLEQQSLETAVAADPISADPQSRANVQPGTMMPPHIPAAALHATQAERLYIYI